MVIIHRVLLLDPEEEEGLPFLAAVSTLDGSKVYVPAGYTGSVDELNRVHSTHPPGHRVPTSGTPVRQR